MFVFSSEHRCASQSCQNRCMLPLNHFQMRIIISDFQTVADYFFCQSTKCINWALISHFTFTKWLVEKIKGHCRKMSQADAGIKQLVHIPFTDLLVDNRSESTQLLKTIQPLRFSLPVTRRKGFFLQQHIHSATRGNGSSLLGPGSVQSVKCLCQNKSSGIE